MKKTKSTRLLACFLSLTLLGTTFGVVTSAADDKATDKNSSTVSYNIADIQDLLNAETYGEYAERNADVPRGKSEITINATSYNKEKTNAKVEVVNNYNGSSGSALLTPADGSVSWDFSVPSTGKYSIVIEYTFPIDGKSTNIERKLRIDDSYPFKGARYLSLTKVWHD